MQLLNYITEMLIFMVSKNADGKSCFALFDFVVTRQTRKFDCITISLKHTADCGQPYVFYLICILVQNNFAFNLCLKPLPQKHKLQMPSSVCQFGWMILMYWKCATMNSKCNRKQHSLCRTFKWFFYLNLAEAANEQVIFSNIPELPKELFSIFDTPVE